MKKLLIAGAVVALCTGLSVGTASAAPSSSVQRALVGQGAELSPVLQVRRWCKRRCWRTRRGIRCVRRCWRRW
ncbi:MAG: hypothetical protein KDJ41_03465 [Hyphomicrobiaceae bacterium]|nr:hypothetical protein [Hyphomicrobiaceae bacterium]